MKGWDGTVAFYSRYANLVSWVQGEQWVEDYITVQLPFLLPFPGGRTSDITKTFWVSPADMGIMNQIKDTMTKAVFTPSTSPQGWLCPPHSWPHLLLLPMLTSMPAWNVCMAWSWAYLLSSLLLSAYLKLWRTKSWIEGKEPTWLLFLDFLSARTRSWAALFYFYFPDWLQRQASSHFVCYSIHHSFPYSPCDHSHQHLKKSWRPVCPLIWTGSCSYF